MANRKNLQPNPSAKNGTTSDNGSGWFGGSRVTNLSGFPRTTGYSINSYNNGGPPRANVGSGQVTLSAYVRCTTSGTLTIEIDWYGNGSYLTTVARTGFSVTAGQVRRVSITVTRPSNADQALMYFVARNGATTVSAVLVEQSASLGDYFDGDSTNSQWDGTNGASTSTFQDVQVIRPVAITPLSEVGRPQIDSTTAIDLNNRGLPPAAAFGQPTIEYPKIRPAGIAPASAVGWPRVGPGPVALSPASISPGERFGTPRLRTTVNLAGRAQAARRPITYDLVLVARVPSASGPPTLMQVDAIPWKGLAYADELSKPQRLDVSASMATVSSAVLRRLRAARELPSELHLYRGSKLVFAGPFINGQKQGETLTLYAQGLLYYARYWWVETDLVFSQRDQFAIGKALVDHWQNLEYGHFGIGTSQVGESGVLRDATYLAKENHNIGQRLEELGRRENGFDVEVDPITRELQFHYPLKGVDRSVGEDAIVFDGSNITNSDVAWSVAPETIASEAYGTSTGGDSAFRAVKSNLDVRAQYGRVGVSATFDGVSVQSTLDQHTQGLLDARGEPLFVPGPDVRVTPDVDPTTYGVGDTIAYVLTDRLGVQGSFRLRKRTVRVSERGRELVTPEFA